MNPLDLFRKFLAVQALVTTLNRLPPMKTFMMDLIYPESVRRMHPYDRLSLSDLRLPRKNIPLVRRGSASYPLMPEKGRITQIEPENIVPAISLTAADVNRFRTLGLASQQTLMDNYIDDLRQTVRKSTEALAIQSISGKISYDIRTADGNLDLYEVNFGTPKTVTVGKKWDDPTATAGDITSSVGRIIGSLQETSGGADIIHLIKWDVFSALVAKAGTLNNPELIKVFETHIQIGNARFMLCESRYRSHKDDSFVDAIPDKKVVSIARDDAFGLYYCALDSFDANFAPLPFYVKSIAKDDPDGVTFIGQSRPMPVPNVDAIRVTQVLA